MKSVADASGVCFPDRDELSRQELCELEPREGGFNLEVPASYFSVAFLWEL